MGLGFSRNTKFGKYFALSQVGFEMVVPIALGVYLDSTFQWSPWGVTIGAIVGLVGGMAHLLLMVRRLEEQDSTPPQDSH